MNFLRDTVEMLSNKNIYVPHYTQLYTPPEEIDFLTYLDDLKYEAAIRDSFVKNVKIINFDIVSHECRGTPLSKSYEYYQTVHENRLNNYGVEAKDKIVGAGLRNQGRTQQPIYFNKKLVKDHFKVPFSNKIQIYNKIHSDANLKIYHNCLCFVTILSSSLSLISIIYASS